MKVKRNFKRINLFNLLLFSTIGLLIVGTSNTIGWFITSFKVTFETDAFGKGLANYFKSGDGSKDNPYIIANHVHMYNLAWLQDLGYFNEDSDNDGVIDKQYYFEIEDDFTMPSDYIIPPIGTSKYPFLGNFNGNEKTITNLNISNDYSTFKRRPSIVTSDIFSGWNVNIVGTFGIIGSYTGMDRITSFGKAEEAINQVSGLYLDDVTINTNSSELLVGIFAGYVNGTVYDCGVHYSQIKVNKASTKISSIDGIDNSYVSNYALVGAYNTSKYSWSDGGSWGNQNDFGGSIDMLTFARRISYIQNSAPSSNNYHATFGTTTSGGYSWLSTSTYTDLNQGSYLPVNIDMESTEMINVTGKSDTSNSYYSSHNEEPILNSNSGYITGGFARTRVQLCNKDSQGIRNVVKRVSGTSTGSANLDLFSDDAGKVVSMDKLKSNIGFLTYYDGNVAAIYDEDDKDFIQSSNFVYKVKSADVTDKKYVDSSILKKYSSVKNNFLTMIYDSTNAYYTNDGSKAYGVYLAGVRFQQWSNDSTFNANVSWLGNQETVKFHNNGVQFELKKDGYLTAIVSKYDTSGNFSFYNLYSLDNLEDANLSKINTIHKDSNGNITYNDSDSNTKIFDFSPIKTTDTGLYSGQLYYFEIPLKKGIYFLSSYGSSYSSGYYPYLLYLDIGANGGDDGSSSDLEDNLKNVDYVGKTNGVLDKVSSTTLSKVAFRIGDSTESVTYYFRRVSDTVYYYSLNYGFITPSTTGTSVKSKDENCNE